VTFLSGWKYYLDEKDAFQETGVLLTMPSSRIYQAAWWAIGGLATFDTPLYPEQLLDSLIRRSLNFAFIPAYLTIFSFATVWADQVTTFVPEPYLVRQLFLNLNPTLTLFRMKCSIFLKLKHIVPEDMMSGIRNSPLLLACELIPTFKLDVILSSISYVLSALFGKGYWSGDCTVSRLRSRSILALIFLLSYAIDCRGLSTLTWKRDQKTAIVQWIKNARRISPDMLHTGLNIALFPLLFFFSGLYYTDVLSTCVVLRMYRLFLERKGAYSNSATGLVWLYPAGLIALAMRQTNIFWVAVFMGALEMVRTIKANKQSLASGQPIPRTWREMAVAEFQQYSRGDIHDVALKDSGVHGMSLLCTGSRHLY